MLPTIRPFSANAVKPYVTLAKNFYRQGVRRKRRIYYEDSKSKLQTIFVRRLNEILWDKEISDNELARRIEPKDPASIQRSISRIVSCKQEPGLEKVEQIAVALKIQAAEFFKVDELANTEPQPTPPSDTPKEVRKRTPRSPLVRGDVAGHKPIQHRPSNKRIGGNK